MMVEQMGMSDVIGPRNIAGSQGGNMFQASGAVEGANIKNKADAEIDRILAE
jgi:ATP-dependent Zn protease